MFLVSTLAPMTFGYNVKIQNEKLITENYDRVNDELKEASNLGGSTQPLDGPMDSPWPMYCHDTRHTGRSPYSTADNPGFEKWFFKAGNYIEGSAAIDNDGVIYFGSWNNNFYALYPDGSLKWSHNIGGWVYSSGPAIDENGVIYVGTAYNTLSGDRLYAFYPNGTVKWTYYTDEEIFSSPAIGNDGTIYFGHNNPGSPPSGYITALFPNGSLNWKYPTGHFIYSDPAIGLDGTVYCGSHDGNLYALYPNNGSLKWKYPTGDWVANGPCIADDGTIYFGSSSYDGYFYALYPNGSLKWKTKVYPGTTPVIADDGTIYVGNNDYLTAVYSNNGSIKWKFVTPGPIRAGNPCISAEGIICFATMEPGYLMAVNPDGTERWRKNIGVCRFSPIIGEDGVIYVGTSNEEFTGTGYILTGFLHAFNDLDPDAPSASEINGPTNGKIEISYDYTFKSISPLGNDVYYYVDWGDQMNTGWVGPYGSGEVVTLSHAWRDSGGFTIRAKVKDTDNLWGPWSEFEVSITKNRAAYSNTLLLRLLEQFPLIQRLLKL